MGIVAKLSECIASRGGNIQSVDVFVPENKRIFYSRRFDMKSLEKIWISRIESIAVSKLICYQQHALESTDWFSKFMFELMELETIW